MCSSSNLNGPELTMESRQGKSKKTNGTPQEKNVQVVVRCRPRNSLEKKAGSTSVVECNDRKGEVLVKHREVGDKSATKTFTFDKVFTPNSTQIEIYKGVVEPIIDEVLMGYNCTVFAYGQTGTGKTYTMEGERSPEGSLSWEEDPLAGIIPRSMHQLFAELEAQDIQEYSVRVSFLELYNEELFDLLGGAEDNSKLRIFEDSARKGSVVINGLEEVIVHSKDEVYSILERGRMRRQTAATLLNACSSRSHSVFAVTVHMKESSINGEEMLKTGKLNLVDLAGSENISRSGAVDKRAREAGSINQSLLTLGRVITSLVEKAPHIPYRESKLTRILQDSLGGRTKTSIIATISPAQCNLEETLSTLDYAHRAKHITNRPEINQKLSKKALIREYTGEIERLKRDLVAARDKNGIFLSPENYDGMENKIRSQKEIIVELEAKMEANFGEIKKLTDMFDESRQALEETSEQLQVTGEILTQTRHDLATTKEDLLLTKQDRDEHGYLVEQHSKTEEQLLAEAGKLVSVVEDSLGDVEGLHSKLDRKAKVETRNKDITASFSQAFHCDMDSMRTGLEHFSSSQKQLCLTFVDKIEWWSKSQFGEVGAIRSEVGSLLASVKHFQEQQNTTAESNLSDLQNRASQTQLAADQFKGDFTGESTNLVSAVLLPRLEQLSSLLEQHSTSVLQATNDFRTQVLNQWKVASQFVAGQKVQLNTLSDALLEEKEKQCTAMQGHQDCITSAVEDQVSVTKQLHESFLSDVSSLLQTVLEKQQQQLSTSISKVSHGLRSTAEAQREHADHMHSSLQSLSSEVGAYGEACRSSTHQTASKVDAFIKQHEAVCDEESAAVSSVKEAVTSGVDSLTQMADTHSTDCHAELGSLSTLTKQHAEGLVKNTEDFASSTFTTCTSLTSSLDAMATNGIKTSSDEWVGQVHFLSGGVATHASDHTHKLAQTQSLVDRYISDELVQDMPTGMTPQRRAFAYPSQLTGTRPHSELLEEFRSAPSLPELPESDSETDTSNFDVPQPDFDSLQDSSAFTDPDTTTTSIATSFDTTTGSMQSEESMKENAPPARKANMSFSSKLPISSRKTGRHNTSLRGSALKKQPFATINVKD